MIHGHGGNVEEAARSIGCRPADIVDMSSNINPLGPPPGLLDHLGQKMPSVCALPQVDAARAISDYARWQKLDARRVLAGAGTTQFLYQLPAALGLSSALVVSPTYADYADALSMHGVSFRRFTLGPEARFAADMAALTDAAARVDAVFFCNPNNPTGRLTPTDELARMASARPDTWFVIDESYLPFAASGGDDSIACRNLANVIVLQSLSKMFCIPGLRIGFCVADDGVAQKIACRCVPWAVNALAQEAVGYIAEHGDLCAAHVDRTREYLLDERNAFCAMLADSSAVEVFDGSATFLLLRLWRGSGGDLVRHLLAHRFLIRDCENFEGLCGQYVRVSLKGRHQNRRAASLIKSFLEARGQSAVQQVV